MRLEYKLQRALTHAENTLIKAPTSLGKSTTVATTPWLDFPDVTGGQPVVHLHQTQRARDEAAAKSESEGIEYAVLEGRRDACPVAAGKHDNALVASDGSQPSEWFDRKCDVEGVEFSRAHRRLREENGGLPCSPCGASQQWAGVPRDEDGEPAGDLIHATAPFAYVDSLVEDTNLIFDEQPTFTASFDGRQQDNFRRGFTRWLTEQSSDRVTWEEFVIDVRRQNHDRLEQYRQMLHDDPDDDYLFGLNDSHQSAAAIGRALLNATEAANSRLVGRDGGTTVVLDGDNNLSQVHDAPSLWKTRCVVGLDAHPVEPLWRLNTVESLTTCRVLSEGERQWWRRHERGLEVVQVGEDANHVTRGWKSGAAQEKAQRLIEALRERYGPAFRTAICGKSIKSDVLRFMQDAGVSGPRAMHYGNHKSRNDFEDESVGLLLGCIDPGDDYVLDMLALCELSAEPESYSDGEGRALGRGFVGPDSEVAEEILASVRRNNVTQAAGRYARHPDSDDSGATVYVWSDVLPEEFVDETVPGPGTGVTEKMREVEECVKENAPATTTEVVESVESSRSHVSDVLKRMVEQGVVTVEEGTGPHGANIYEYHSGTLRRPVDIES